MAELGETILQLMLVLAAWAGALAAVGVRHQRPALQRSAELLVYAMAAASTFAMVLLCHAFAVSDFSLSYVQQHSNRAMPLFYRITGAWGGQEGSLLVWAWLLALFSAIAIRRNRVTHRELVPYATVVLMAITVFFGVLLVTTSNPFETFLVTQPTTGQGLNPLLQNPYMVTHPPALYLGFCGMAIPFAFGAAALLGRRTGDDWVEAARPWAIFSWFTLSIGLVLGMLWAYEELGWGGYWGWDPVENAGLFPWLTCTALIHSFVVQSKRGMLRGWSQVLALLSFVLTIFGTFLTRSGFIASVHAFSRSNIGYVFLAFIALTLLFGFGLIISRRAQLRGRATIEAVDSREAWFVLNNIVLLLATFLVLTLTVFPNLSELFGDKKTINPEAFNRWMAPIGVALLLMTAVCPLLGWRRTENRRPLLFPMLMAVATGAVLAVLVGVDKPLAIAIWALCGGLLGTVLQELLREAAARARSVGCGLLAAIPQLIARARRRYGGFIVHLGVAMMCLGFAGEAFKIERQVVMRRGQREAVGDYILRFDGLREASDAQKRMLTATLTVFDRRQQRNLGTIEPAHWTFFRKPNMPTSEVGLLRSIEEDLFVALGNADPRNATATFKLVVNPLVSWIWIGFLVMIAGTVVAELLLPSLRPRTSLARRKED